MRLGGTWQRLPGYTTPAAGIGRPASASAWPAKPLPPPTYTTAGRGAVPAAQRPPVIVALRTAMAWGEHCRNNCWASVPPPPCRSPPLVVPRGGGGASLGQPKIFRCGSLCCCVGHCHLYALHSWQDILLTFAEMELGSTTMFPPGTNVMFIHSTGEPVLAQVVGHSEHGDAYRRITYDRDGKIVLCCNFCACKCACTVVVRSPRGGWGTVTWQPSPRGWWGTVFPGVGNDKGGGVRSETRTDGREQSKRREGKEACFGAWQAPAAPDCVWCGL